MHLSSHCQHRTALSFLAPLAITAPGCCIRPLLTIHSKIPPSLHPSLLRHPSLRDLTQVTFQLDEAMDDLYAVQMWTEPCASTAPAPALYNLSVILSTGPMFNTSNTSVVCTSGLTLLCSNTGGATVLCPALSGTEAWPAHRVMCAVYCMGPGTFSSFAKQLGPVFGLQGQRVTPGIQPQPACCTAEMPWCGSWGQPIWS